jgi:hypothetical protein
MTIKAVVRRLLYALFSWPPSDADKRRIVSEVARQSSIRNLLGTETCEEMVAAQLPNFDKIITIDPDDRLCSSVLKRFAPHPNFDVANGASHQILPRVLLRFSGPVLCWMEGYYRKGSARGKCDAPIWDELRAVFKRNVHGDRVLIDGAHLFALGWLSREYPSISRLRQFVSSEQPNYTVEVRRDIIQIVPKSAIPDLIGMYAERHTRLDVRPETGGDPIAVGTRITARPPHRSERAQFGHSAPTSGV